MSPRRNSFGSGAGLGVGAGLTVGAARRWRQQKGVKLSPREILLYSDSMKVMLRARMDEGYPHPVGGYGGWTDEERPGQVSATLFRGAAPRQLPLRLLLGGYPKPVGDPAAQQIQQLDELGAQDVGAPRGRRPPLLRVRGAVRHGGDLWFIDDVQFGSGPDDTITVNGVVVFARVTVTLKRHVGVQLVNPDAQSRRTDGGAPRRYTVKRGENAWEIVRNEVGTRGSREAKQAIRLLRWGSGPQRGKRVRDPRRIRAGDVLILPRRELQIVSQGEVTYG